MIYLLLYTFYNHIQVSSSAKIDSTRLCKALVVKYGTDGYIKKEDAFVILMSQMEKIDVFFRFDTDGNCKIDAQEILNFYNSQNEEMPPQVVHNYLNSIGKDALNLTDWILFSTRVDSCRALFQHNFNGSASNWRSKDLHYLQRRLGQLWN